jgi:hypothetical protein
VTATCYTVLGVANKMITVLANLALWDKHASPAGVISLLVCLLGAALYKQAPVRSAEEPSSWVHSLVRSPIARRAAAATSLLLAGAAAGYWAGQMQLPGGDLALTGRLIHTGGDGREVHALPGTSRSELGWSKSGATYAPSKGGVHESRGHHTHSARARGAGIGANHTHSIVTKTRVHRNHTHVMAARGGLGRNHTHSMGPGGGSTGRHMHLSIGTSAAGDDHTHAMGLQGGARVAHTETTGDIKKTRSEPDVYS